jgi:hypothetical protein
LRFVPGVIEGPIHDVASALSALIFVALFA